MGAYSRVDYSKVRMDVYSRLTVVGSRTDFRRAIYSGRKIQLFRGECFGYFEKNAVAEI